MKKRLLVLLFSLATLGFVSCSGGGSGTGTNATPNASLAITPQDIPSGYGYPGNQAALQALADIYALTDMRVHSWNLWAGMTSPSASSFGGSTLPIWETELT